jgi:hypothetical protein
MLAFESNVTSEYSRKSITCNGETETYKKELLNYYIKTVLKTQQFYVKMLSLHYSYINVLTTGLW